MFSRLALYGSPVAPSSLKSVRSATLFTKVNVGNFAAAAENLVPAICWLSNVLAPTMHRAAGTHTDVSHVEGAKS